MIKILDFVFKYRFDKYRAYTDYSVQEQRELDDLIRHMANIYSPLTPTGMQRAEELSKKEGFYRRCKDRGECSQRYK